MSSRLRGPSTSSTEFTPDMSPACTRPDSWLYSATALRKMGRRCDKSQYQACDKGGRMSSWLTASPTRHALAEKPGSKHSAAQPAHLSGMCFSFQVGLAFRMSASRWACSLPSFCHLASRL